MMIDELKEKLKLCSIFTKPNWEVMRELLSYFKLIDKCKWMSYSRKYLTLQKEITILEKTELIKKYPIGTVFSDGVVIGYRSNLDLVIKLNKGGKRTQAPGKLELEKRLLQFRKND